MRDLLPSAHALRDLVKYGPAELKLRLDSFDLLGPEKNETRFGLLPEAEAVAANAGAIAGEIQADLGRMRALDASWPSWAPCAPICRRCTALPPIEAVQRQTMIVAPMRGALLGDVARQARCCARASIM